MKVTFDLAFLAATGLTEEETTINLPDDFPRYTPSERREWARRHMELIALEMLDDLATAYGRVPTAAEKAAYLADIQPGIDAALAEGTRCAIRDGSGGLRGPSACPAGHRAPRPACWRPRRMWRIYRQAAGTPPPTW